ncbi:MAG TPA: alpha/beta hydrolase domain-containing protein [Sphingomonas sp.]|nr:alpha/beta hydrolase domain-containing protein [Sphingomonas sp.]
MATTLAVLCLPLSAAAKVTEVEGPIPVTPTSTIFGASEVPGASLSIDLDQAGYIEQEYFVGGTANAWRHDPSGAVSVLKADIPYTTRIIVRRPRDGARFSGVMHFEPIHPSQGGTTHWLTTGRYMMAHGDIYVAAAIGDDAPSRRISAKGLVPIAQSQVAKWFDPARYAPLHWPDEDGIRYQVMAEIGALLRSDRPDNPLRGLKVRAMLVGGWSFTGSVQRTFIDEGFHDRFRLPDGRPIFDGYLIGISSRWNGGGYVPLNSEEPPVANDDPRRTLKPIDVPVIEFLSEFEVATGPGPQRPDSDAEIGAHRLYELGGVIHSASMTDPDASRAERPNLAQLVAKGYPLAKVAGETAATRCPLPISDVPHGALARAALDNLRHWVLDEVSPPHAPPLATDANGKVLRDATGNPTGGIPVAEFDVPRARYGLPGGDDPACVGRRGRPTFVRDDLSRVDLIDRYGNAAGFVARYDEAIDRMVSERWLLPDDAAQLEAKARADAQRLFATGRR